MDNQSISSIAQNGSSQISFILPEASAAFSQSVATKSRSKLKHKRRATRACLGCRARKVRCDVVECLPCRNCKWDGIDCVIQEGRRKHKSSSAGGVAPPEPTLIVVSSAEARRPSSWADDSDVPVLTPSTTTTSVAGGDEKSPVFSQASPARPDVLSEQSSHNSEPHDETRQPHSLGHLLSSMANVLRKSSWDIMEGPSLATLQAHRKIAKSLPKFIRPPSADLDHDALEFLQSSGALTLPPPAAQRSLLKSYIQGIHYNMPCVDIHNLLRVQVSPVIGKPTVSLTLYQAIMFAGAMYVDQETLKDMGFSSRPAAIKDLFRRAKLLHSLEYDREPVSVVQSLLLFSLRSPESSGQQGPSFWTQLAISMIHREKMHCEATRSSLPTKEASLWKRLWCCCIMRDTFNALGGCQAPSIKEDECEISFLELDDFDIAPYPGTKMPGFPSYTIEEQTRLAELFIELGDLSLRLARVLWAQFHSSGRNDPTHNDELLVSLEQWYQDLPPSCQHRLSSDMLRNEKSSLVDVQRSFLHMAYHTAVLTLHRHCVMPKAPADEQGLGTSPVAQAANSILQIAADLVARGIDHLMPVTGIALVLPALIVHSLDAATDATHYKTAQDAYKSMQILEGMRDRFAFADMAACYLEPLRQTTLESPKANTGYHGDLQDTSLMPQSVASTAYSTSQSPSWHLINPKIAVSAMPGATALSPSDHPDLSHPDQRGFMDIDSSSPESFSFEQFGDLPLTNTPDFAAWGQLTPGFGVQKETAKLGTAIVDDGLDAVPPERRDQGIFQHIEEEIIQMLANN